MDIGTGLVALGSKDILLKILGPSAEYIGNEIKGFVEKCNVNLNNIFLKANDRFVGEADSGVVSPRVLKSVIDDGRFCEDELVAEYYAGILVGSKNKNIFLISANLQPVSMIARYAWRYERPHTRVWVPSHPGQTFC